MNAFDGDRDGVTSLNEFEYVTTTTLVIFALLLTTLLVS